MLFSDIIVIFCSVLRIVLVNLYIHYSDILIYFFNEVILFCGTCINMFVSFCEHVFNVNKLIM